MSKPRSKRVSKVLRLHLALDISSILNYEPFRNNPLGKRCLVNIHDFFISTFHSIFLSGSTSSSSSAAAVLFDIPLDMETYSIGERPNQQSEPGPISFYRK